MGRNRRWRRAARARTLLPLHTGRLFNTISCWYCDLKISAFNNFLFSFGQKKSRFLHTWFSVGVGFSITALVGVTTILLWELVKILQQDNRDTTIRTFSTDLLFGLNPLVPIWHISLLDAGYLIFSTILSVSIHEFGHAIAAASEGVQIEYIAIFLAILFPGALVAFSNDVLECLPRLNVLRIYCAGIWHNAVLCAACGLALFILPLILHPLYIRGDYPMILEIDSASPLSGHLSPGNIIISLDGSQIHSLQDWMKKLSEAVKQSSQRPDYSDDSKDSQIIGGRKGYCVHNSWLDVNKIIQSTSYQLTCPNNLSPFVYLLCGNSTSVSDVRIENNVQNRTELFCLNLKETVKLEKCGSGWSFLPTGGNCSCPQDHTCLAPVLAPVFSWVEIVYATSSSSQCLQSISNIIPSFDKSIFESTQCGGSFVFIGDVFSIVSTIKLTMYYPRWVFKIGANVPNILEKMVLYTFYVSATLALLNSLPVFFLDGEFILEAFLTNINWLNRRRKRQLLQLCLLSGSSLTIFLFSKAVIHIFLAHR